MADTATIEKPAEAAATPVFDSAAFIAGRNKAAAAGEKMPTATPAAPAAAKPAAVAPIAATGEDAGELDEEDEASSSATTPPTPGKPAAPAVPVGTRALRRELNRVREELGFERGQKAMLQALIDQGFTKKEAAAQIQDADPEPKREQFATDAEYAKAIGAYEGRRAAADAQAEATTQEEIRQQAQAAKAKYDADIKTFPDWDAMKVKMASIPLASAEHPDLVAAILVSDNRAKVLYHFAKEPEACQKLLALKGTAQLLAFSRLEGKLETMYNTPTAADADKQNRTPPEKPAQGGTAAERDLGKPRPTAEVVTRGGTPAPDEPIPGSAAWMAARNAARNGR